MSMLPNLLIVVLTLVLLLAAGGCSNDDPTGPTVLNSGDQNAFNFADRSPQAHATSPPPVVITPVINEPPPPILFNNGPAADSACVSGQGTSTRTVIC